MAKVAVSGNTVTFSPPDTTMGYALTVIGPGDFNHTQHFEAGALMTWTPTGTADGVYKFELRSVAAARDRNTDAVIDIKPVVMSGSVRLENGQLANTHRRENIQKDVQHLDDVIISFSLCIGNDCVNGESFGFDTLRLKENNIRIHFDDTSTSASFPRNDWRIIINDSSNGGGNYWAVEDSSAARQVFRVDAGAPANSLRVDAQGDLGINTSNPVVDIHVVSGNTPTLRLEQNGSSGFTAQTWDLAGNEANFFIRDATNGSKLAFRIEPNTPQDALYLEDTGDIGIGTNSPDADIHVVRSGTEVTSLLLSQTGGVNWSTRVTGTGTYRITDTDAAGNEINGNEFNLTAGGNLSITGTLTTIGSCSIGCDLVFDPSYDVPSIEDHAADMWANRHLPAVGPTSEDGPFNLSKMTGGMLNELEKAHIYIEQLNDTIQQMQQRLDALETEKAAE